MIKFRRYYSYDIDEKVFYRTDDVSGGERTSMTICKNCGSAIKWFRDTENDKWIPLESNCDLQYEGYLKENK